MTYTLKDGERFYTHADGRTDVLDANGVVKDGQTVRVPMILMDSQRKPATQVFDASAHRPRMGVPAQPDNVKAITSHAMATQRTADAWKKPAAVPLAKAAPVPVAAPVADAPAAHARLVKRTEDAWINPRPR